LSVSLSAGSSYIIGNVACNSVIIPLTPTAVRNKLVIFGNVPNVILTRLSSVIPTEKCIVGSLMSSSVPRLDTGHLVLIQGR